MTPPLWRESRMGLDLAALTRNPVFRGEGVTDGRGQPVMLIPGFMVGDGSLGIMARWLKGTGHHPSRAGIRSNVACSGDTIEALEDRLERLVERQGSRAAIVGHSRGGSFAKVLARRRPDLVSGIVMLGCPQRDPLAVHPSSGPISRRSPRSAGWACPASSRRSVWTETAAPRSGSSSRPTCRAVWATCRCTRRPTASWPGRRASTPRGARRGPLQPHRHGGAPRCVPGHRRLAGRVPQARLSAQAAHEGATVTPISRAA